MATLKLNNTPTRNVIKVPVNNPCNVNIGNKKDTWKINPYPRSSGATMVDENLSG